MKKKTLRYNSQECLKSVCLEPDFKSCEHHTAQLQRLARILQTLYLALVHYYSLKEMIYTIKSGWSIVYINRSQIILSKYHISVPECCFFYSYQTVQTLMKFCFLWNFVLIFTIFQFMKGYIYHKLLVLFACWEIFRDLLSSADFFFKINFFKKFFTEHYQSFKQIGSRSAFCQS